MKTKFAAYMQTSRNLFIHRSNYFYLGDIMKKKLSNDEIEERKKQNILESAKMNSCISGKTLSDLIEPTSHRGNYGDKDCMVKQQFLKNLVEPATSRELFETLKRQNYTGNYNTFRGLLFRYQKYGYVQKLNNKKPFTYGLTDKGIQHARNPYLSREEGIRRYRDFQNQRFAELINNDPATFKQIYEYVVGAQNSIVSVVTLTPIFCREYIELENFIQFSYFFRNFSYDLNFIELDHFYFSILY